MSQELALLEMRKLPVWRTVGDGAKIGFTHFWLIVGINVAFLAAVLAITWPFLGRYFLLISEMQSQMAAHPNDPAAMAELMRQNGVGSSPVLQWGLWFVGLVVSSAFWVLIWRIIALGRSDAFKGTVRQWTRRSLVGLLRYVSAVLVAAVIALVLYAVLLALILLTTLIATHISSVLAAVLVFVGGLALLAMICLMVCGVAAVAAVSLVGTSCDQYMTLRSAYRLLQGSRLRAGWAVSIVVLATSLAYYLAALVLLLVGLMHFPTPGAPFAPRDFLHFMEAIYLIAFVVGIPVTVWGLGTGVAIFRFAVGGDEIESVPAAA